MEKGTMYSHVSYYLRKYRPAKGLTLEIGCGAALYRDLFEAKAYMGSDIPNPYYQGDKSIDVFSKGEFLPYKNASVELIFSQAAIDYVKGLDEMLRECHRVLSGAGKMLVFTYDQKTLKNIHANSLELDVSERIHHHVYTEDQMQEKIRNAGFQVRALPFLFRPHIPLMPMMSAIPFVAKILNSKTHWRNFLAWKGN